MFTGKLNNIRMKNKVILIGILFTGLSLASCTKKEVNIDELAKSYCDCLEENNMDLEKCAAIEKRNLKDIGEDKDLYDSYQEKILPCLGF